MNEWLQVGGGTILVAIVLLDVFSTVIVPRPTPVMLRLGPLLARMVGPVWQALAGTIRSTRLRQDVRGALAPLLLVVSLMAWLLFLSLGFGLILHGQPGDVRADDSSFAESVFQASMALSTLGFVGTDVDGGARVVVAVAGIAGFAVLTLVITFLLSIQSALHRRETLVLRLATRAGRPPFAARLIAAFDDDDEGLAALFDEWEAWTADVMQSHLAYPVLCRFRSLDEDSEWLTCLATVLDAAAIAIARHHPGSDRAARRGSFLIGTAERALGELTRLLNADPVQDRAGTVRRNGQQHSEAVARLDGERQERLRSLRARYVPQVCALSVRLDIRWHDPLPV